MAGVPTGAVKPSNWWLFFSVALLLFQFFLRSYNSLVFTPSHNVIPLPNENNFLFVETDTPSDRLFKRLLGALISLLVGAALYAIGKRIFSRRVGIMAQWLYAVLPFTIFYDRMGSDSSVTVAAMLIPILAILIWLESPGRQMGGILAFQVGAFFSAAIIADKQITTGNFLDNLRYVIDANAIYYWSPALLITAVAWLVLMWQRWRWGILLALLLGLTWLPALVELVYPRNPNYLEAGIPFLLLILVAGLYEAASLIREPGRRDSVERLIMVSFLVYGLAWGFPFWETLVEHPQDLNIPVEFR